MKKFFTAKFICRSAIIAALYAALTWVFAPLAFGPIQVRISEALCLLPLFYAEAIPGLFVGCLLANIFSAFGVYDVILGGLTTLIAALCTYFFGKFIKNKVLKVAVGGVFPILLNAFLLPLIWLLAQKSNIVYWYQVGVLLLTQSLWVYGLGIPLCLLLFKRVKIEDKTIKIN